MRSISASSSGSASSGESSTSGSSACHSVSHSCRSSPGSSIRRLYRAPTSFETPGTLRTLARVNVLVVGSGGREHALAWKLAQSPRLAELHAAPGNPGIASLGACHPVRAEDGEGLLSLARSLDIDLVVIG